MPHLTPVCVDSGGTHFVIPMNAEDRDTVAVDPALLMGITILVAIEVEASITKYDDAVLGG
jgi:hypothetical protein